MPEISRRSLKTPRAKWADHLGIDEDELVAFLSDLHFVTGRSRQLEEEIAVLLLDTLGLNSNQGAVDSGLAFVRDWVQSRDRERDVESLRTAVEDRLGRFSEPGALVVVEAIDDDPAAEHADVTLRFLDLYEGDDPFERRRLGDSDEWTTTVWPKLAAMDHTLREARHTRVVVAGAMRLPTWFGVGCALRDVRGFSVSTTQRGEPWSSSHVARGPRLETDLRRLGDQDDLAVIISIADDASVEALRYIAALPIGHALIIAPQRGTGTRSIPNGAAGAGAAQDARTAVRRSLLPETERIHLFMAAPAGFALLLGHWWNSLRPTLVYEHLGAGRGYERTFEVPA